MEIILFLLIILLYVYFFRISKDKQGNFKIERRANKFLPGSKYSVDQIFKIILKSNFTQKILSLFIILIEIIFLARLISPIETLLKVRTSQLIPVKFNPIARFVANMDWETMTIKLDASMSKAYEDKITNYIWRIDDGTSLVGETTLEHRFINPGYYLIQLSVVDADNQSDVATCQILIPPAELEQITTHERLTESTSDEDRIQDTDYAWAPKGTFFNYSKMQYNERSYANLKSHYIESGCDYSNKAYNTLSNSYIDFLHNDQVQRAFASILRTGILALMITPVVYWAVIRFLKKI